MVNCQFVMEETLLPTSKTCIIRGLCIYTEILHLSTFWRKLPGELTDVLEARSSYAAVANPPQHGTFGAHKIVLSLMLCSLASWGNTQRRTAAKYYNLIPVYMEKYVVKAVRSNLIPLFRLPYPHYLCYLCELGARRLFLSLNPESVRVSSKLQFPFLGANAVIQLVAS